MLSQKFFTHTSFNYFEFEGFIYLTCTNFHHKFVKACETSFPFSSYKLQQGIPTNRLKADILNIFSRVFFMLLFTPKTSEKSAKNRVEFVWKSCAKFTQNQFFMFPRFGRLCRASQLDWEQKPLMLFYNN